MKIDKQTVLQFVRAHGLGVVSTVSAKGAPQAALVNIAVTDDLELIFYTIRELQLSSAGKTKRPCSMKERQMSRAARNSLD
jgi:hypothetical protein